MFLPALATSAMLILCYFPIGWSALAWVALVPLLTLVRVEATKKRIFFMAWISGLCFFGVILQWMRVADYRMYATWAMLAVYCSLYFPVAIGLIRVLDKATPLPLLLSVPIAWVGLEYIRSFLLTGFAWYYLGHTQHDTLHLIQIADVTGVYGVSFLIAAVNGWLFELWYRRREGIQWPQWVQAGALVAMIAATVGYGDWRLSQGHFEAGPRVALVQSNLDVRIRNDAFAPTGVRLQDLIFRHFRPLLQMAKFEGVNLVVWPETSFPYTWYEFPENLNKIDERHRKHGQLVYQIASRIAEDLQAAQLIGVNNKEHFESGDKHALYNSAIYIDRQGRRAGRYDKIHRVPFGEYVPLRDWIPFMNKLAPYDYDFSILPGKGLTRLDLEDTFRLGVLICYEDSDPFLARNYSLQTKDGPPVDFLVNISNDGWFDGSAEHDEHLAICRFRAIEARRTVARSVNMGISAVIDGNGRVRAPELKPFEEKPPLFAGVDAYFRRTLSSALQGLDDDLRSPLDINHLWVVPEPTGPVRELPVSQWADFKKSTGILIATLPIDRRSSLYARFGDWLPLGCWIVIAGGFIARRFRPLAA